MNRTQLLIALNVGGSHLAGETGIFGNVLKIPTAQRAALDIHSGAKQNTHILSLTLVAQNFAKKMIVNCLIKRVDVCRDYKLHIDCYEMLPLDGGHFITVDNLNINLLTK